MLRCLLRCLAAFLLVVSLSSPFAAGQGNNSITLERGVKGETTSQEKSSSAPTALPYFVMAIYTMLVLTIVYMPSRKA
ncbi:MAG TPA: hypothetical protein VMG10_03295 [Gemmataceae bacterium]|nr:hypothetical protein [Gemmataceae bacterium]